MKIQIIVGSTRQGRATPKVAKWVEKTAKATLGEAEVELVDIKDYDLPFFDEALPPQSGQPRQLAGDGQKWLDKLAEADGYIFVTPEYNHGTSAVLKNAIDYADNQLKQKPAAIVSHGSIGGARANEQLRLNLNSGLGMVVVPESVTLHAMVAFADVISDDGELQPDFQSVQQPLEGTLASLVWYTTALKTARDK